MHSTFGHCNFQYRCIVKQPVKDIILLFHPRQTNRRSSCIQGRFKEIISCRDLDIFVNMHQKIEQDERTNSAA